MHCSANQQIIDNSFGWRIEEIVRERQHQPRHNRAADHRWRLVSSSCQPGPQIFHPQTNDRVTVWRNSSLSERRRPSTTEPLRTLRDTSCLSFCARPALHRACASLTSLLAPGFRPRRPSPRSARPVTLRLPMSPPPWPRRHASASARRAMLPSWSRTLTRHSPNGVYGISRRLFSNPSGFAPENLMTFPHFSVSSAMSLPKSAGEPGRTAPPRLANRAFSLGSARPALISVLSFSTISDGVFFGALRPTH